MMRSTGSDRTFNQAWIGARSLSHTDEVPVSDFRNTCHSKAAAEAFSVSCLRDLDRLCRLVPAGYRLQEYTFLDVGCGSGIAVLYAATELSFKSCAGFDFEPRFVDRARENAARLAESRRCAVRFWEADAATVRLAPIPYFVFLFNPFKPQVLGRFLDNNLARLQSGRSIVAYANDKHRALLAERATTGRRITSRKLSIFCF